MEKNYGFTLQMRMVILNHGKVENVWVSGKSYTMIKVILDNGKEIITTPNHKYMLRDGSYLEAENLKIGQSLMPLYFSYQNGYENVKSNSSDKTKFYSVYKIVANTELKNEIEEARIRSGEDIIQIHHSDFQKLNNYPSNLKPMGKMEHWMYHANLSIEHKEAFVKAGRNFWENDPRRFEALEKQKQKAREYQLNMWGNFTPEERQAYIDKSCSIVDREKLSKSLREVWNNYTEEEKIARLQTNNFIVDNPMQNEEFRKSEIFIERNKKISVNLSKYMQSLNKTDREAIYSSNKGKKFSDEHKQKISKALKGRKYTPEQIEKYRLSGIKSADKNKKTRCKRVLNTLIENNIEITPENFLANRKSGDPHFNKVFSSFEDMLQFYNITTAYNHKVKNIEVLKYETPIDVYDIEVKDYHNFFVNDGVMLHNCYRFAYMATQLGYKYGEPQNERNKYHRTNKENYGSMCKHLVALLSNKRWLQQVTSRFVDWLVENLDQVNEYLRLPEDRKLTAPDAEARQRGKQASLNKWANRVERIEDIAEEYLQDRKDFIEHNEDEGIIEDIQRWLKDNYTAEDTGYDYVKATPEEIRAILNYVTKDLDRGVNNNTEIEDEV